MSFARLFSSRAPAFRLRLLVRLRIRLFLCCCLVSFLLGLLSLLHLLFLTLRPLLPHLFASRLLGLLLFLILLLPILFVSFSSILDFQCLVLFCRRRHLLLLLLLIFLLILLLLLFVVLLVLFLLLLLSLLLLGGARQSSANAQKPFLYEACVCSSLFFWSPLRGGIEICSRDTNQSGPLGWPAPVRGPTGRGDGRSRRRPILPVNMNKEGGKRGALGFICFTSVRRILWSPNFDLNASLFVPYSDENI